MVKALARLTLKLMLKDKNKAHKVETSRNQTVQGEVSCGTMDLGIDITALLT